MVGLRVFAVLLGIGMPMMAGKVMATAPAPRAVEIVHQDRVVGPAGAANCNMTEPQLLQQALAQHNLARQKRGRAPMQTNAVLTQVAVEHACDMARRGMVSHSSGQGLSAGQRALAAGYSWHTIGENVAAGAKSVVEVVQAWQASPGHRANLLDRRMREFGLGWAISADGRTVYWAAVYARPR